MYKPNLRYLFIIANPRSLWPQISVMKYLLSVGTTPLVICQRPEEERTIASCVGNVVFVRSMPNNYDVAFSQSTGLDDFERDCLIQSWESKKYNIKLHNSMSTNNSTVNPNYTPNRVNGRLHGMCMKEERAIGHFSKFNDGIFYLNTGDPDWDYFRTDEFNNSVRLVREYYGDKLLLICSPFVGGNLESNFWSRVCSWASSFGFKVVLRPHPGRESRTPDSLLPFVRSDIHRHVAFAAASHVIVETCSTVIGECMMLGTKVATYPLVPHYPGYGNHMWIENSNTWNSLVSDQVGSELLSYVPCIWNNGSLNEFLSCSKPLISGHEADKLWGWPIVNCYSEYLFQCVEKKLGVK